MMKTTFDFEFGLTSDHLDGKPISVRPIIDLLMSDMYHDPAEDTTDDGLEVCYCGLCQEIQPALIQVEDYIAALRDQLEQAREVMTEMSADISVALQIFESFEDSDFHYDYYGQGETASRFVLRGDIQAAAAWLEEA